MPSVKQKTDIDWRQALSRKSALFSRVFGSAEGQEVLELLSAKFQRAKLFSDDPYRTAYQVGQHELVAHIKDMIKRNDADE